MTPPRCTAGAVSRQRGEAGTVNGSPRSLDASGRPIEGGKPLQGMQCAPDASTGRSWRLWFPARLGPARRKSKKIGAVTVKALARTMELPPTKNTKHGNPFSHASWVKEWRDEAKRLTKAAGIPPCARIRLSAVVYRKAIGVADAENDHARLAALQDGLVDAGVVPKDTYLFVQRGEVVEQRAGANGVGIMLTVEEVPS